MNVRGLFTAEKEPLYTLNGSKMDLWAGMNVSEERNAFASTGTRTPERQARSLVGIRTAPLRLTD
jgi:hypothetical protein